jgi:AcrR family transcriptional regulator
VTNPSNEPAVEPAGEAIDAPWRERVIERSLGAATRQTLDRAQALLGAAVELLELSGEDVTVQEIADRAGFSLRVLYRHFSSKDDLLAAVLEDHLARDAAHMRQTLLEISDPIERLAEFVRLTIRHQRTPLNLALAKRESLLLLTHPDEVVRAQARMTELGRELIQAAVDAGHLDAGVAKHGLYSMMALKRSYNRARLLGDDFGLPLPTDDELVQHCLRALGITLPTS